MTALVRNLTCLLVTAIGIHPAMALTTHVDAVRTYDEDLVQANKVDMSATPLTVAQMTAGVAAAFDAGSGGVINFDNGSFTDTKTIDANFAAGTKSLRLTSSIRDWSIGVLGTGSGGAISGPNVVFLGSPTPFPTPFFNDIVFGDVTDPNSGAVLAERVTSFGFTILDATFNGSGNNLELRAYFSDGSSSSMNYTIPLGNNSRDTFFGWTAPPGAYFTHVSFSANNNTAGEDWAFITAPVPEPMTGGVVGIGYVGVLFVRLRRREVADDI